MSHATSAEYGWLHCGPAGAGHFVKMVHNGVEYGIMQAYLKDLISCMKQMLGQNMLRRVMLKLLQCQIQKIINMILMCLKYLSYGVVVLLLVVGYLTLPLMYYLAIEETGKFGGGVSDSGEGRWTVHAAVDLGVPAPVISSALCERFNSRNLGAFAPRF